MTMKTLEYYATNAEKFVSDTFCISKFNNLDKFLMYIPSGATVLDWGCGSGRDSLYMLNHGFKPVPVDGCQEICKIAENKLNIPVKCQLFNELTEQNKYAGIWANASLLHLTDAELIDIFPIIYQALRFNGYCYISFKVGNYNETRDGKFYNDMTEDHFYDLFNMANAHYDIGLSVKDIWYSSDSLGRSTKWFNIILKKNS